MITIDCESNNIDNTYNYPMPVSNNSRSEHLQSIATTILTRNRSCAEVIVDILMLVLKVVFFPFTLIHMCIERIAVNSALGTEGEAKRIDFTKRNRLREFDNAEEIKFGYEGGPTLEGMLFGFDEEPTNPNQKTILLCSGSHHSYEYYVVPMVEALRKMGHRVMVFNYQGFGKSEGTISEEGVYQSVEAAYDYLRNEKACDPESIVGWGYSLGSAAVTNLATKHEVDIVLDRGVSTISHKASETVDLMCGNINEGTGYSDGQCPSIFALIVRIVFACVCHFDNLGMLYRVKGRVLIAQESLPLAKAHGERLKSAAENAGKAYVYMENVMHGHLHDDFGHNLWFREDCLEANKDQLMAFLEQQDTTPC